MHKLISAFATQTFLQFLKDNVSSNIPLKEPQMSPITKFH